MMIPKFTEDDVHLWISLERFVTNLLELKSAYRAVILSSSLFAEWVVDKRIVMAFEPNATLEEFKQGLMGELYGAKVYSYAFTHPQEQKLKGMQYAIVEDKCSALLKK